MDKVPRDRGCKVTDALGFVVPGRTGPESLSIMDELESESDKKDHFACVLVGTEVNLR